MTNKERFISILTATNRDGIDWVLEELEKHRFFEAPASSKFHLSCDGGLVEHSLNVYDAACRLREQLIFMKPELEPQLPNDSIAICSLLHDTCKTDIYKKTFICRKTIDGSWEKIPGYDVRYEESLPLGHGEKSVIMLLAWGLDLTDEEMLAIRWHMTCWDLPMQSAEHKNSLNAAKDQTPLVTLIQLADGFAAGLMER